MQKSCDFCSRRIGSYLPQAHEAENDGLCLCRECYSSLWKWQTNSTSQVKQLAGLALSGKLRPKVKSIVVKHLRETVPSRLEVDTNKVTPKAKASSDEDCILLREKQKDNKALINESKNVISSQPADRKKENPSTCDVAEQDIKNESSESFKERSQKQDSTSEPIVISYDRLCEIEKELSAQVHTLFGVFGHYDLRSISIEKNSLYEQIKDLDKNERSCYLILEAEIDIFLFFRKLLNSSSGIEEKILLPLSITRHKNSNKPFLFYPEYIVKFIQYQHENVNLIDSIKKDPSILDDAFKNSGFTDFETFKRDMIFLSVQKTVFCESLLDLLGVVITEKDYLGRIGNIRYNE